MRTARLDGAVPLGALLAIAVLAGCPNTPRQALQACNGTCPPGMTCELAEGAAVSMCVYSNGTVTCDLDEVMVDGACIQAQKRGRTCSTDAICGAGYECRDNPVSPQAPARICWPKLTDISGTVDGQTYSCDPGEKALGDPPALCIATCGTVECQPNQFCQASTSACTTIDPILRGCVTDNDCRSDDSRTDPPLAAFYCAASKCLPALVACKNNAECPSGFQCGADGLCVEQPAVTPPVPIEYCADADGDGWCANDGCVMEIPPGPPGWRPQCAHKEANGCDGDGGINPGASEGATCDLKDNNCNGAVDEGVTCGTPPPACEDSETPLKWSCYRTPPVTASSSCIAITEPADAEAGTWNDNYLCGPSSLGLAWSSAGRIAGKSCLQIFEGLEDPAETWTDNYLCWTTWQKPGYATTVKWSEAGPLAGFNCLQWNEPSDPDAWSDNFLCWKVTAVHSCREVCHCPDGFCSGAPANSLTCRNVCRAHEDRSNHDHGACGLCN